MITHDTDPWFEQQLRSMLHEIAERFDPAVSEADLTPSRRRRLPMVAASLLLVIGLVGVVFAESRSGGDKVSPGATTVPGGAPRIVDRLLYPGQPALASEPEASIVELSGADVALLVSPSGRQYTVGVGRIGATVLDPLADQRGIAGRTVAVERGEQGWSYQWIDQCVLGGMKTTAGDDSAWDDEAVVLLSAIAVDTDDVSLLLPPGWTVVSTGTSNPLIQLVFDVDLGGVVRTVVLGQSIGGSIASVLPGLSGPFTPTDLVPGRAAWVTDGIRSPVLLFDNDGVAVGLWGNDLTLDDLAAVAAELVPRPDDWTRLLDDPVEVAPPATPPPGAALDLCGAPTLTIR